MKKSASLFRTNTSQLTPSGKALRELYRTARQIYHADPYAAARLARIADQAEYFLQSWPEEEWPTSLNSQEPMPSRHVLMAWTIAARREALVFSQLPESAWSYTHWRQITTTLLAALAPFS